MLPVILAALLLGAAPAVDAAGLQQRPLTPVPGTPGTPTPTPYPQITPSTPPKAGDNQPGAPLLPPMPLPGPPKDQPLPGLQPPTPKGPVDDD
ncbi:hypothetical protein [Pseudomonas entomophila]|uniref:Uncharacterized protein n=2 Tax=Pseudomonas entomophila TaxID=312306 RepID=Q1I6L0_PSEE4|nr:hypothetical protein [Pseudomonas entomophila]WMW07537.1 hypothetical protein RAH46_09400 [Pseudomonas entomophila]CAK16725.1 hypothetical protein; putative signal peptide [Pseudomonas entomophila L48]